MSALLWVDNNTFFAIYSRPRNAEEPSHTPFILERNSKREVSYLQLEQVSDFINSDSDVNSHFYLQLVRKLGSDIPFLITIANANATALNLVGKETDGKWSTWLIENGGIPKLPTSSSFDDTFPIGLAVDYSSLESFTADESSETVSPMPILLFLTNEGKLCAYHYYSSKMVENGEKFDNMVPAIDIKLIPEADMTKTTAKKEALPDKETKVSTKTVKKPNPEPTNARVSKVPVIKTAAKSGENNKSDVSTSPTSSTPSGIPRPKHASIGWGSLSNASNTSVPAKSNVALHDDVSTSATKKPDTSLTEKTKPTPKQAFGQSANVDLSSKNPFGSTSFVPKPKSEQAEAEQAPKPSSSSNTEHSDSHSSAGSDDFVKISTDFSNNETQDEAKDTTKPGSYSDRNTDQNESQDVNQTQPAPNQQKNKKEMASQEQQDGEKRESQKEPEITTSAEQNADKPLPAEPEQVNDEDTTAILPENDSKKQELEQKEELSTESEQKEKNAKEQSTEPEQSNKEEQADVSGQGDEEKSPVLDESKTDKEKEDPTPKDKDVNKVAETVVKDNEVKKQDPVQIEEQVKEQEPVLKDDKQEETETSANQDSTLETAVQVEKEVDVENKKEAPTESKEASVQDSKSEESSIQQVPQESEESDKPKDEAGPQEDSDQEEFEKIEKPETPEPVEEDNSQVAKVASNSEEKNPEPVSNLDKQKDAPSDTTSTPDQEVKTTPKEIDVQLGKSGKNETEKKEAEVIVPEPSTGRTALTNDNATSEVPVNNQKPDETKNENTFDKMTDERISHTIDDETTSTADELSTDDEETEELEELSSDDEGTEELEECSEEEFEVEPPKPKPEIFFETYQKKHLQPTQNYQNTATDVS